MSPLFLNIGIDLDNTIINYDDVLYELALQESLILSSTLKLKKNIRNVIQALSNGDREWQKLQSKIYGAQIHRAKLADGVKVFFKQAREYGAKIHVVSHKTIYSNLRRDVNFRDAAINWMEKNSFFDTQGLALSRDDIYFEDSRSDKVRRICRLGCTHFIDDLEETFYEDMFPMDTEKLLYSKEARSSLEYMRHGIKFFSTWEAINQYFFRQRL